LLSLLLVAASAFQSIGLGISVVALYIADQA